MLTCSKCNTVILDDYVCDECSGIEQEISTLKRQVEVFVDAWANNVLCVACVCARREPGKAAQWPHPCERRDVSCRDTMRQWSLEQAKKGGEW
jgi:hypothetical protein